MKKKKYFPICILTLEIGYLFLVSDLRNIISYKKEPNNLLVKLSFSLKFKPLDPDPRTQLNADPTGSRSTKLIERYRYDIMTLHTIGWNAKNIFCIVKGFLIPSIIGPASPWYYLASAVNQSSTLRPISNRK